MGSRGPDDERDAAREDEATPVPDPPDDPARPPEPVWPPGYPWSEVRVRGQHQPYESRGKDAPEDAAGQRWSAPETTPVGDMPYALAAHYAPPPAPAPSGPLRDVLAALSASGVDLSREELLDALWLAGRLPPDASAPLARATGLLPPRLPSELLDALITGPPAEAAVEAAEAIADADAETEAEAEAEADADADADDLDPGPGTPSGGPARPPGHAEPRQRPSSVKIVKGAIAAGGPAEARATTPLYAGAAAQRVTPRAARALPVRTPGTTALGARQLQLGRALRPLKQSRPDRRRWELDEAASADAAAESGLADAVLRPGRARWLDLALLVDDGVSMLLWQRLAAETRQLLERSGAFRTVRVLGLDTRSATAPLLGRAYSPGTAVLAPATVTDPGGNTLVLVVSDGVGAAWRDGRMRATLKQWARYGPTAVLHALPEHLWDGSGLRAERWQVSTRRRGAPNLTWDVADPALPPDLAAFDGIPVPVLAPEPDAVGAWAALVASPGTSAVLPLLAAPDPVAAPPPRRSPPAGKAGNAGDPVGTRAAEDAAKAVLRFRDAASPPAYRLAAQLAALAPLSVPVMRLTQDVLGGEVTTGHLAEVFLSGLMHRTADSAGLPPQHRAFDFTDEARGLLLSAAPVPDLVRTARAVSQRLAELAGRSPDFPAWMAHPAGTEWADAEARPFGWVDERLLRRLGVGGHRPPPAGSASGTGRTAPRTAHSTPPPAAPGLATVWEVPAYVDAPRSDWRSLLPGNPQHAGLWRLFARHYSARTTSGLFLGRLDATGEVAAVRLTRPGSVACRSLRRQAEALRVLNGEGAPRLMALDAAAEPVWLATGLAQEYGRPAPDLERCLTASGPIDDTVEFARFAQRLAGALARAHAHGIVHGDLVARRVHVADDDVCVTGWCVEEHPDGIAHDISQLAQVLRSMTGAGLPLVYHELLRLCGSPLRHQRPSAAEVADWFAESARTHAHRAVPGAAIGRTDSGAELVLDFDRMGPHGAVQGSVDEETAVLDLLVRGLAAHHSPADVQIVLVGDATRFARPQTANRLPHVVLAPDAPDATRALSLELRRRQALDDKARATNAPPPAQSRLIVVLTQAPHVDSDIWRKRPRAGLGVHVVRLNAGRRDVGLDCDFVIDFTGERSHAQGGGAPGRGILRYRGAATPFTLLPDPPLPPLVETPAVDGPGVEPSRQAQLVVEHRNAVTVGRAGHPEQALADLTRVAEYQRLLLGHDHPDTLDSTYELANLHAQLSRYDEALDLCSDTAARRARALGTRHVHTLVADQQRAFLLGRLGRHEESCATYRTVLATWNTTVGPYHPGTLLCRHNLAVALILLGRYQEAVEEIRAAYSGRALVHGPEHPDTLASAHELVVALHGSGRRAEAAAQAADVHATRLRLLGPNHPDTRSSKALLFLPNRPPPPPPAPGPSPERRPDG